MKRLLGVILLLALCLCGTASGEGNPTIDWEMSLFLWSGGDWMVCGDQLLNIRTNVVQPLQGGYCEWMLPVDGKTYYVNENLYCVEDGQMFELPERIQMYTWATVAEDRYIIFEDGSRFDTQAGAFQLCDTPVPHYIGKGRICGTYYIWDSEDDHPGVFNWRTQSWEYPELSFVAPAGRTAAIDGHVFAEDIENNKAMVIDAVTGETVYTFDGQWAKVTTFGRAGIFFDGTALLRDDYCDTIINWKTGQRLIRSDITNVWWHRAHGLWAGMVHWEHMTSDPFINDEDWSAAVWYSVTEDRVSQEKPVDPECDMIRNVTGIEPERLRDGMLMSTLALGQYVIYDPEGTLVGETDSFSYSDDFI